MSNITKNLKFSLWVQVLAHGATERSGRGFNFYVQSFVSPLDGASDAASSSSPGSGSLHDGGLKGSGHLNPAAGTSLTFLRVKRQLYVH